jgi:hypothetical protein
MSKVFCTFCGHKHSKGVKCSESYSEPGFGGMTRLCGCTNGADQPALICTACKHLDHPEGRCEKCNCFQEVSNGEPKRPPIGAMPDYIFEEKLEEKLSRSRMKLEKRHREIRVGDLAVAVAQYASEGCLTSSPDAVARWIDEMSRQIGIITALEKILKESESKNGD